MAYKDRPFENEQQSVSSFLEQLNDNFEILRSVIAPPSALPDSPFLGQLACDGKAWYQWNGAAWIVVGVKAPVSHRDGYVPQWNGQNTNTLKEGLKVGTGPYNLFLLDENGNVPPELIGNKTITNEKYADASVDDRVLANEAVTSSALSDSAVVGRAIANGAINRSHLGFSIRPYLLDVSTSWNVPSGVYCAVVFAIGGGSGGRAHYNLYGRVPYGGVGGFWALSFVPLVPGETLQIIIGEGGNGAPFGHDTEPTPGGDTKIISPNNGLLIEAKGAPIIDNNGNLVGITDITPYQMPTPPLPESGSGANGGKSILNAYYRAKGTSSSGPVQDATVYGAGGGGGGHIWPTYPQETYGHGGNGKGGCVIIWTI